MFYLARFLIDVVYAIALYVGYCAGQAIGVKYMFTDMYIARLYCGFIGVAVVSFVFSKIKGTLIFFIKAVGLYATATNTKSGEALKGIIKRLGSVFGVAAVTKLLTEAINDVQTVLLGDNPSDKITEMFPILANLPFNGIINLLAKYYTKSFTYLDECILAYSFAMNKPIMQSIKDAFMQFLKKAHVIMAKLIVTGVTMTVINITIAIIGLVIYFKKFIITLHSLIVFYIVIRAIMYIVDDAFLEPLLLQSVIREYVSNIPTAAEELEKNMMNLTEGAEVNESTSENTNESTSESISEDASEDASEIMQELNKLLELPAVKRLMSMEEEKLKKVRRGATNE